MINTNFKIGDLVTNPEFCEDTPFNLSNEHFKGVAARNQLWFDHLIPCSKEKITLEKVIEEIQNKKEYANKNLKSSAASDYWTGYYDSLGELLEYIEDNL